jgi:ribose 5-phosphate isomerase A
VTLHGGVEMAHAGDAEADKRTSAEAAALLVEGGMTLGLGTGSTVAYLLPALASRKLDIRCVATSVATQRQAADLGLDMVAFEGIDRLDIAIDGADQVSPDGWLVQGGGGAHVREKVVAEAADRFVVIVSGDKIVKHVHAPIPVEILAFGAAATLRDLEGARLRPGAPPSPDGGLIADWYGNVDDPAAVARWLEAIPGVIGHGLFPPALVHDVIVASGGIVEHRRV